MSSFSFTKWKKKLDNVCKACMYLCMYVKILNKCYQCIVISYSVILSVFIDSPCVQHFVRDHGRYEVQNVNPSLELLRIS